MKKTILKIISLTAFVFVLGLNINTLFVQDEAQSDLTLSSLMNVANATYIMESSTHDEPCEIHDDDLQDADGGSWTAITTNCYDSTGLHCGRSLDCEKHSLPREGYSLCRHIVCYN